MRKDSKLQAKNKCIVQFIILSLITLKSKIYIASYFKLFPSLFLLSDAPTLAHHAAGEEVPPLLNSLPLLKTNSLTRTEHHMNRAGQAPTPTPGRGILAPLEMHV
jgi:hypothetical protein